MIKSLLSSADSNVGANSGIFFGSVDSEISNVAIFHAFNVSFTKNIPYLMII